MKIALFVLILIGHYTSVAQEHKFDEASKRVIIEKKYTDLGKSKDQLYDHLQLFASSAFKGGTAAVDMNDGDKGIMITRGSINHAGYLVKFNIIIRYRDNDMKYTLTDITIDPRSIPEYVLDKENMIKSNRKLLIQIQNTVEDNLKKALSSNVSDDW